MANGDYGYFGKGDTGYAQYMTAFNRNFGGSSGGGGGSGGDGSGCGCLIAIAVVVVLVLLTLGLFLLKKKDGLFQLGKGKARLLPAEANYSLIFLSFVVSLVVIALAAFVGGSMAYYLLYAMVAWLFALLVYYTVKMI